MSFIAAAGSLLGVAIILSAGIGLLRLRTPYARIHAAGKASPVAFLVVALSVSVDLGWSGGPSLLLASVALVLTLPVAVHLLFRAVHAAAPEYDPPTDEIGR
jgi:multicomponent Na+:H+ antiporter subunit G